MFKVGDKVKCIEIDDAVYVNTGDINTIEKILDVSPDDRLDLYLSCKQYASSKNFVKVEE